MPIGNTSNPWQATKAILCCGEHCSSALFFPLKQIHVPPLPFPFVFLSMLEHGYQRQEAFGAAISRLGSLPAARDESRTRRGVCGVMLHVGFVCSFPRQTPACLPASPSSSRFPEHDSERGSGYQREVPKFII